MKILKRILIVIYILALFVLLFPDKAKLADGGTVIYKAILYEVTFFHRCSIVQGTIEGTKIVILGKEIYNDSGLDY